MPQDSSLCRRAALQEQRSALRQRLLDIASSQIRDIFASGNNPRFLLPDAVMEYIERNTLFGPGKS